MKMLSFFKKKDTEVTVSDPVLKVTCFIKT